MRFDDGDVEEDAIRREIVTLEAFRRCNGETKEYKENVALAKRHAKASSKRTPVTKHPQTQTTGCLQGLSLNELLLRACGTCDRCTKKDCGDCGSCKANRFGKEKGCCFHKVRCCSILLCLETGPSPCPLASKDVPRYPRTREISNNKAPA